MSLDRDRARIGGECHTIVPRTTQPFDEKPKPAPGVMHRIRTYFLTGLIVAGPVAVTLWLVWWFVTWVDNLVRPLIPLDYRPETYMPVNIPGFGLIIVFITLTMLGFLTANLIGRKLVEFGESLLGRMPIVRPIYRTTRQIFQTLFSKSESSFRKVALVEFPSPGMWSLVFLTQSPTAEIADRLPDTELRLRLHAVHAEPDDRLFLLCAQARRDRARHQRRTGDDGDHVGRHCPAGQRSAGKDGGARRDCPRRAIGAQNCRPADRADTGRIAPRNTRMNTPSNLGRPHVVLVNRRVLTEYSAVDRADGRADLLIAVHR